MAPSPRLGHIDALTDASGRRRPRLALVVAILVTALCALQWVWSAMTVWRLRDPDLPIPDWAFQLGAALCIVAPVLILVIAIRRGVGWGLVPMAAICLAVVIWIYVSCVAIVATSLY